MDYAMISTAKTILTSDKKLAIQINQLISDII